MRPLARAFVYYKNLTLLIGFAIFVWAVAHMGPELLHLPELALFFLIILVGELLPVTIPGSNIDVTVTIPAIMSLFLSHGSPAALTITPLSIIVGVMIVHRKQNFRWLVDMSSYNTAMCTIPIGVASWVYHFVGGRTIEASPDVAVASMFIPLFVAVIASTIANTIIFTTGLSLNSGDPWRLSFFQSLRWFAPNFIVTAPSGILFAMLYKQFGFYGVLMMIVPFIVGRQALNMYSEQMAAYMETVTTLGSYMQHYHTYTKGHLERVASMSDKIAKQMGLPYQSLMFIREAGLLHDIGKVGVSEEILDNTGKLSDEDWNTIKQHPARGAEILIQMKHFERIVPWVRGHHERPDGKGYPDGLSANDLSIEAAVIAVADSFDAMVGGPEEETQRVYRFPKTISQGIDELRFGSGTQFDPRVVKAFMQVMDREELENGRQHTS